MTTVAERDRHAAFLTHMLLLAFLALAVAPLFLAFRGAPTPAESLLFALSLAPAAAAMMVARTGRLTLGHLVAFAGFVGIALILLFGVRAGPGAAIAWLVAAQIEAAAALDRRLARVATLVSVAATFAVVTCAFDPRFIAAVSAGTAALLGAVAVLASTLAATRLTAATHGFGAAQASREARARALDAVLDTVALGLDKGGSVLSLSKPEASFLSMPDHAVLGRGLIDQVLVADRPAFLKVIDDAAHGSEIAVGTFRMQTVGPDAHGHSPRFLPVEMRARRVDVSAGRLGDDGCEVAAVLTDVSARDRCDRKIVEARLAVEESLRGKDQFLTSMSHELRTPLNAIIGFSEMLASRTMRPDDVARQCEFARVINQSGRHLLAIVNAVLDLSKIQSGAYSILPEPFDPIALLDQTADAVAAKAKEGALLFSRDYPSALEEMVGDKRALKQALVALLANAIKFTPANGRVTIAAKPQGNALLVTVADTGIGIAPDDLARIGDPFFQATGSTARPYEGSGLGLALVRGLVGLHGGSLAVESEIGAGTRVTVKLPLDCRFAAGSAPAVIATTALQPRQRPLSQIKDAA